MAGIAGQMGAQGATGAKGATGLAAGISKGFSIAQAMWITALVLQVVTVLINEWERAERERIARREEIMEIRSFKTEAEFNRWENDQRRAIENAYRTRNIP